MSFGGYGYNEALDQTIESAKKKNIISVAAAGNDNTSKKHYPSALENTISIASVDSSLNKSSFSNYGAEITFAAPGTNIKSIMGKDTAISIRNGNNADNDHETISGTSMATPHAAAAVAVLKGYNKNLTFKNVVDILKNNAQDLGEKGWDQYYGNGLISFKDVEFCDGTYCDKFGIYKDINKSVVSIDVTNLSFTQYNYYSITNLMGSTVTVNYTDNTSDEKILGELPNIEILNYNPTATGSQTVTIKMGSLTTTVQVTNPNNYQSGWEYNTLSNGKIEITGYKNHNLGIKKLYVPETLDSKQVASFADNFKFAESGNDIESYTDLYLPSTFTRIGNYALAGTNIKHIYGQDNKIEVGAHAFENSKIVSIDTPIIKIDDYAFKNCFELVSIKVWEEQNAWSYGEGLVIGNYAFYNCKKLASIEMTNEQGDHLTEDIGNYAFYNCFSLSYFDLEPGADIGEYSFYNTFLLTDINLYQSESIGRYAFYGSGISELSFSISLEVINESAFENCKNLKELSFNGDRIESRAFWGSGIEIITIGGSRVEYIAEDAFAYAPIKRQNGLLQLDGSYQVVSNLGIVENGNKLLVGFTNAQGASNTIISENITEIGNYAFTGNNQLKKITIPANVTKIGTHAFEDCYQLSDVYMLGNTINFGNNTFKRNYDGEIQEADFKIYVYKDSAIKQFVKNKNLKYRHIEPDEIVVTNYENTYKVLSQVDFRNLGVKLIYHEEEDREEVLDTLNYSTVAPISNGVGFGVSYQTENAYNFQYGDTYFIVEAKNAVGYLKTQNVEVTVEKITPNYTIPTGLTANYGQRLSEIVLPEHFEWMDGSQIINSSGNVVYRARYIPTDTKNYATVENIDITITVKKPKKTDILYKTHVERIGWQNYSQNGGMAGTTGKALRLEGIKIKLENQEYDGDVEYRTHIESIGWEKTYKKNDEMSGTKGRALRLEAIEINLTEEMANHYDIYYRVHAENFGWLGWARNGEKSGTAGYAYRLEGIEIKLVEKGQEFQKYGEKVAFIDRNAVSQVKLNKTNTTLEVGEEEQLTATITPSTATNKKITWTSSNEGIVTVTNGKIKGISEGTATITASSNNGKTSTCNVEVTGATQKVEYKTHVENIGWENKYKKNGEMSGTSGKALRLEGIKIRLKNYPYTGDIEYRTHIENIGWEKNFKKNDEMSGTSGRALRLEAIEIKLTGEMANHYDIYYRVHAENFGWLGWARNGERAGTAGYAYRLEGIEIKLVEKGQVFSEYGKKVPFKGK